MRAARHLPFVPAVVAARGGDTVVEAGGRVWELAAWVPGMAFASPSDAQLAAACRAIADLHRAWTPTAPTVAPFPAVARRLGVLRDWRTTRPRPVVPHPDLAALTAEAADLLPAWAGRVERDLVPLAGPVSVRPCLCDVHRDHVLFAADAVTGVIDYGAMAMDHPAVDLARYLGDTIGDDSDLVRAAVDAYRAAGGSTDVTPELVAILDRTGAVGAAANWLLRLAADPNAGGRPDAVAARLGRVVRRMRAGFR